jgi:polysaccharide pyruvyl transferase WcaK-like protein
MRRRDFLQMALAAGVCSSVRAETRSPRHILLRSSWQVVNIGDIAHTPGVLSLLEKYLPDTEVRLWASRDLSNEVIAMEHRRFPKLKIVKGTIGTDGRASTPELGEAIEWADFLLHGSGPSLVAQTDVAAFSKHTGKPYGVYGITYGGGSEQTRDVLSRAKFAFFRDSVSLATAKSDGIASPIMEFSPDGAFAVDLRNDEAATKFLAANGLEEGKFMCCIPRLRNTPYWKIRNKEMSDLDRRKHAENEKMKDHDHAPHRAAIAAVVRETGMKVLVCPEDASQMEVGRENIVEKLPAEIRKHVVWRENFWLTDEALSTYVRSAGLFGNEMHSPIMCIGNGIPAVVCRWAAQTSKGFMWRDIGLGDWLFDMDDEADVERIVPTVLEIATDPASARRKVQQARQIVERRQRETMGILKQSLTG